MMGNNNNNDNNTHKTTIIYNYSHSVVPGGLAVRSYRTRDIPSTSLMSRTILSRTYTR